MTSMFDGMASILSGVLGATVTVTPQAGPDFTIEAILREDPVDLLAAEGQEMPGVVPTLMVNKPLDAGVEVGAQVTGSDGRRWRLINSVTSGSPASDAFEVFELERVIV